MIAAESAVFKAVFLPENDASYFCQGLSIPLFGIQRERRFSADNRIVRNLCRGLLTIQSLLIGMPHIKRMRRRRYVYPNPLALLHQKSVLVKAELHFHLIARHIFRREFRQRMDIITGYFPSFSGRQTTVSNSASLTA